MQHVVARRHKNVVYVTFNKQTESLSGLKEYSALTRGYCSHAGNECDSELWGGTHHEEMSDVLPKVSVCGAQLNRAQLLQACN